MRAVSLLAESPSKASTLNEVACAGIRRELGLAKTYECTDRWTMTIEVYSSPTNLNAGAASTVIGGNDGDLVRVRLTEHAKRLGSDTPYTATGIAQNEREDPDA